MSTSGCVVGFSKKRKFISVTTKDTTATKWKPSPEKPVKAVHCTQCFPLFREEILALGRHMVQFTLGGGRSSPGLASINTFLVNSLIAVRYRKPPRARSDMTQVCLQLITQQEMSFAQNERERKERHFLRPSALPHRSSSRALLSRRSGSGGDLFLPTPFYHHVRP